MNILKMLITSPNPQDSVIFIDDKQYVVSYPKYKTQGLKHLMENMFQGLSKEKVNEVICKTSLSDTKPQKKCEIAKIEPFLFRKEGSWCNAADMQGHICEKVAEVIGLITWLENDHFKMRSNSLRNCIICNETQHTNGTGQYFGGLRPHGSIGGAPGVREEYKFPSDYCLNPKCFSHEIWRAINPEYTVPKNIHSFFQKEHESRKA